MKYNHTVSSFRKKYCLSLIVFICFLFSSKNAFAAETGLPPKYDPRETGQVTPVKAQTRGICWSYATNAAIESYLAKNGELHELSENYYNYLIAANATGTVGENPYSTLVSNGGWLDSGYSSLPVLDASLNWFGPVNNSAFPNAITGYQPVSKWENLKAEKHVQGQITLPAVSLDISQEENNQRVKMIKDYVYRYGNAIQDNLMYRGYETGYSSQFIPKDRVGSVNHVTTIVGWDDSFNKEKFVYTPSQDGAFIVKNSWGTNWGDQGYFYISYDDFQLKKSDINIITSVENKDNYYKKYTVAYFTAGQLVPVFPNEERTLATSYSRSLDTPEQLSAVSIRTLTTDMRYEIYVLPNGKPSKNLAGFTKVQEGIKKEIGTETIRLNKPVSLTGKDFSIAVVYRSSDKVHRQNLPVSPVEKIGLNNGSSYSLEKDGTWSEETYRSFFISGFTEQLTETTPTSITVQKNHLSLLVGGKEQVSATLNPENVTNPLVGFRSLNPAIASVDSTGMISAIRAGKAKIEAFSTRTPSIKTNIEVIVSNLPSIQEIQLSQTDLTLDARQKATLSAKTLPENAKPQKIIWTTSNPLITKVNQTGEIINNQPGTVSITATTEDGTVKASCTVSANSEPYSNGHSFIRWGTDIRDSSRSPLYIENPMKETVYFQYGAGFLNGTKDNWMEFHLSTPKGKTFEALDYPDFSWFTITNVSDSITDSVIEYTTDGTSFSKEKPAIQDLEGFRIHYAPKITSNLRLFVHLKLKVIDVKEEDKGKNILPIQLKKGYHLYRPTTSITADGINPSFIDTFNIHFLK